MTLGGGEYVKPRFNFASAMIGTKLIMAGGLGYDYKLLKDFQEIELDQRKVKRKFIANSKMEFLKNHKLHSIMAKEISF